MADHIKQM